MMLSQGKKERELSKTYSVESFDSEKEGAKIYDVPNSYKVMFVGSENVAIDQVQFIPGKTFEQIVAEMQNIKQPE